ncbi:hypothetical protein BSKO_12242 [Bryopsis sp. KO-2023]|nr:hypothetical protein BSKO_12242 [Bryopsis sp. KO-2023]
MDNGGETVRDLKRRKLVEGGAAKLDPPADVDSDSGTNSHDEEVADASAAAGDLRGPVLSWFRNHLVVDEKHRDLKELRGLDERLLKHLETGRGFSQCFPVQYAVWRELSGGSDHTHDLCVCSPTGSGKTLAYCLPIAQALSRRAGSSLHCLGAIIILPTAALASQVFGVAKAVCGCVNLRVEILGLRDVTVETKVLQQGACRDACVIDGLNAIDVLVTTPGHLLVHLKETKALALKHMKFLVVDEADVLMKGGDAFEKLAPHLVGRLRLEKHSNPLSGSLNRVFRPETSMRSRVLKVMVSATVTRDPGALSSLDIHHARLVAPQQKKSRYALPQGLEEFKLVCPAPLRPLILVKLLKDFAEERTLIFAQTVETASRLYMMLCEMDEFKGLVAEYSAHMTLKQRKATLDAFRKKEIRIMVASDALSRGIDVANIKHVVNYDTPSHVKKYIHRVGRTARAGDGGKAYSLIRKSVDEDAFNSLRAKLGKDLDSIIPNVDELRDLKPQVDAAIEKMKSKLLDGG